MLPRRSFNPAAHLHAIHIPTNSELYQTNHTYSNNRELYVAPSWSWVIQQQRIICLDYSRVIVCVRTSCNTGLPYLWDHHATDRTSLCKYSTPSTCSCGQQGGQLRRPSHQQHHPHWNQCIAVLHLRESPFNKISAKRYHDNLLSQ